MQLAELEVEYVPAPHEVQLEALDENWPGAQALQADAPSVLAKVPPGHAVQLASPELSWYLPTLQALQLEAPAAEYWPGRQLLSFAVMPEAEQ